MSEPLGFEAFPIAAKALRPSETFIPRTIQELERSLILQTLDATGWVIGGSCGAAAQLGLKRTTLVQRLERYAIHRPIRQADFSASDVSEHADATDAPGNFEEARGWFIC